VHSNNRRLCLQARTSTCLVLRKTEGFNSENNSMGRDLLSVSQPLDRGASRFDFEMPGPGAPNQGCADERSSSFWRLQSTGTMQQASRRHRSTSLGSWWKGSVSDDWGWNYSHCWPWRGTSATAKTTLKAWLEMVFGGLVGWWKNIPHCGVTVAGTDGRHGWGLDCLTLYGGAYCRTTITKIKSIALVSKSQSSTVCRA